MQSVDDTSSKAPVEMNNQESSQPISPSQEKQSRNHEGTKKGKASGVAVLLDCLVFVISYFIISSQSSRSSTTEMDDHLKNVDTSR
jgi:hypothetical protein